MFGLFKKKPAPELSDQAKYLLELLKQDGWTVWNRYDRYLRGHFGEAYIEISESSWHDYELTVRVGDKFFYMTDKALTVPLTDADRNAIAPVYREVRDQLQEEHAERERVEAIRLVTGSAPIGADK